MPAPRQNAEHGQPGKLLHGPAHHGLVARVAGAVENGSADAQPRLEVQAAADQGGGRAGHLGAVKHQQRRREQDAGQFGRGAGAGQIQPVEKPPVALYQGNIMPGRAPAEQGAQGRRRQEKGIQIPLRGTGRERQPGRVNIVGAIFEGLDAQAGTDQGPGKAKADHGLAGAAGKPGYDKTRNMHRH